MDTTKCVQKNCSVITSILGTDQLEILQSEYTNLAYSKRYNVKMAILLEKKLVCNEQTECPYYLSKSECIAKVQATKSDLIIRR